MNAAELKKVADGAVAYGKKYGGNKHQQYSSAKKYVDMMHGGLPFDAYEYVVRRIADRLGV